jgi:hypothetical protein
MRTAKKVLVVAAMLGVLRLWAVECSVPIPDIRPGNGDDANAGNDCVGVVCRPDRTSHCALLTSGDQVPEGASTSADCNDLWVEFTCRYYSYPQIKDENGNVIECDYSQSADMNGGISTSGNCTVAGPGGGTCGWGTAPAVGS